MKKGKRRLNSFRRKGLLGWGGFGGLKENRRWRKGTGKQLVCVVMHTGD
jgi:hypothetical protein